MAYAGDFALGKTFDIKFTTIDSTGAPITLAGTPAVSAYPDNSTTEITAGITLTVDFDTRTGLHNVRVVATSGNGYATTTNYALVLTAGTVGGVSVVGYVITHFSIENRSALRPATADRTLVVDASGLADANTVKVGPTGSGTAQTARDLGQGIPNAVAGAAGGLLIAGSNAATTFATLTVTGATTLTGNVSMAAGLNITQSTANTAALVITGNGSGNGATITGGAAVTTTPGGNGLSLVGGASSTGAGGVAGFGLLATGGAGSASTNGAAGGVQFSGGGTNTVASAAHGITITGTSTGHGAIITSGSGATGDGIHITSASTNGYGAYIFGSGTGSGLLLTGGATGHGLFASGGATSGDGLLIQTTSGHGINIVPAGSSKNGINVAGGNAGTSDGVKIVAGTGGVGLRIDTTTISGAIDWADLLTDIAGTRLKVSTGVIKNTALSAFAFKMLDSTDHISAKTGLTITATRSIDGAAFAACANTATELSNGFYLIDLANTDLNGNVITLRFTAAGADAREITIITTT